MWIRLLAWPTFEPAYQGGQAARSPDWWFRPIPIAHSDSSWSAIPAHR